MTGPNARLQWQGAHQRERRGSAELAQSHDRWYTLAASRARAG